MGWFNRGKPDRKPESVLHPEIAARLDEATTRLEFVADRLMKRLDELEAEQDMREASRTTAKKTTAKKPPAKKTPQNTTKKEPRRG